MVKNPYGSKDYRVEMSPDAADGFVFWTRNFRPLGRLLRAEKHPFPFVVQYTVTNYPKSLEQSVIPANDAIKDIKNLAGTYGARSCVWRYDPIVFTSELNAPWHRRNFRRLAEALCGSVDEVVISFVAPYTKTRRNLHKAEIKHSFEWRDPGIVEKQELAMNLANIAATNGMQLTTCSQPEFVSSEIKAARCIDKSRLSDVAGHEITARTKGNRKGCACHQSRDIGAYDTCPHGCVYCYAVRDNAKAKESVRRQSVTAERLG